MPLPAIDTDYLREQLKALLSIPSPTGYTDEIVHFCGQVALREEQQRPVRRHDHRTENRDSNDGLEDGVLLANGEQVRAASQVDRAVHDGWGCDERLVVEGVRREHFVAVPHPQNDDVTFVAGRRSISARGEPSATIRALSMTTKRSHSCSASSM